MRPSERGLRAATAACLSTGVALAMHVAGGGDVPSAAGVLVPLGVAFAASIQLAGVALSRWRLATAVAFAQMAFHAMFSFGSGGTLSTAGSGAHASHNPAALTINSSGLVASTHHHAMGGAMIAAHAGAAIATYAVLRRADVLLAWGARLVESVLRRLTPGAAPPFGATRTRRHAWSPTLSRTRVASTTRQLRAPPVALA